MESPRFFSVQVWSKMDQLFSTRVDRESVWGTHLETIAVRVGNILMHSAYKGYRLKKSKEVKRDFYRIFLSILHSSKAEFHLKSITEDWRWKASHPGMHDWFDRKQYIRYVAPVEKGNLWRGERAERCEQEVAIIIPRKTVPFLAEKWGMELPFSTPRETVSGWETRCGGK